MSLPTNTNFERLLSELNRLGDEDTRTPSQDPAYQTFIARFPADKLENLSLDTYCVGRGNNDSFCWWLERGLEPVLGRYMPGTARGHLLYFAQDGSVYKNGRLSELSDEDALRYTLGIQAVIARADTGEDLRWIDDDAQIYQRAGLTPRVTVGDGRKLRLLAAYHPDEVLPISSSEHVAHFLAALGYPPQNIPPARQPVARMLLLREYWHLARESHPGLTSSGFMRALYSPQLALAPVRDDPDDELNSVEAVLAHFAAIPELAVRLQASGQTEVFFQLAVSLHEAGLDWWITGAQAMHAGRTDDPKVWQTAVALELECAAQGLRGRLNTPGVGASQSSWQMLDNQLAEHWAEQAAADSRVRDLSGREAFWPDDYDSSDTALTVLLTEGAVQNGYIKVPKLQKLFPSNVIAADEKAPSDNFQLFLPNKTKIATYVLANRNRIKARFNGLFKQLGVKAGDRAVIQKEADGLYRLLINAVPHALAAPAPSTSAPPTSTSTQASPMSSEPLNQILYGPPGTGKTYATIERTLRILDPALLATLKTEPSPEQRRTAMKARFDALKAAGRVRFVTFHQSFSYEDFVEGIRAQSGPEGLRYSVEPGVFKQLCQDAADMPDVDKVIQQFLEDAADKPQTLTTPKGKTFTVTYQEGNETVACLPASSTTNKALPANIDSVKQVLRGQPPQKIYCESYVLGIANHLKPKLPANGATAQVRQPHVLIIDEINRGNVSRIFGELITLIEPSKRAGQAEALSTTLPYSREPFTVPDNVYLIGTMNTADRSLASLDVALRRRFVFEELPPEPALLNGVKVAGRVPVDALLSVMNQRIEALLDRDHLIGHASFMPLVAEPTLPKLAEVFRRQVLPLLQEYFFEDWQRIQWVLNDHRKPKALQFVRQSPVKVADLFGANVQVSARPLWEINKAAFDNIEAYVGVISSSSPSAEEAGAQAEDSQ